jgi:hypothetical protein
MDALLELDGGASKLASERVRQLTAAVTESAR